LDILNRYFKGVYMPKNTFFEGTKKIFCAKKFLGLFVHVQRWLVQKKKTLGMIHIIQVSLWNAIV